MSFFMKPKTKALKKVAIVAAGLFIASTVVTAGAGALGFLGDGQQQVDKQEVERHIAQFRDEVESNPEDVEALKRLGNAKMQVGVTLEQEGEEEEARSYYEKALETYKQAYEIDDSDIELKVDKASAAYSVQQFDRAEELLDGVLDEEPEHQHALHMSASLAFSAMDFDTAIEKWEEIIEVHDLSSQEQEQFESMITQAEEMKGLEDMEIEKEGDAESIKEELEENNEEQDEGEKDTDN